MIWQSHRVITGVTIFLTTQSAFATFAALSGSIFPDKLDIGLSLKHRGVSHWWPIYLLPLPLVYFFWISQYLLLPFPDYLNLVLHYPTSVTIRLLSGNWAFWFLIGSLLHILEDAFTGYIPLRTPKDWFNIYRPFYTGSPQETHFVIVYSLICLLLIGARVWQTGTFIF